ncbi:MAG: hypothetical protein WA125_17685 [Desulfosporosinus sp.]
MPLGFQDNLGNPLGVNNADNLFDSSSVTANADGSILERLEVIQGKLGAVDGSDNPIGANDADNGFDSSAVVANADGSILERVEYISNKVSQQSSVALVAANLTGSTTRFTVAGGPILIKHLGVLVTTGLPAGANTLKFSFTPTGGGATDLSAATDTASAGAQQLFIVDGVKATGLVKTTDVGIVVAANEHMPIIVGTGVIQTIFSAGPPATGAVTIFIEWEPLAPGAQIT